MALPVNGSTHLISAYYSFYRPRKDERLSWPSWLTCSGWLTHISGHPSAAGRAQDRGKFAGQRPTFYHCATPPTIKTSSQSNPTQCRIVAAHGSFNHIQFSTCRQRANISWLLGRKVGLTEVRFKRHLDQFSRFCSANTRDVADGRKTTQAVSMQCTHRRSHHILGRVPYNFVYHWDWRPNAFRPTFQPMVAVMYVCDAKFRTG